MSKAIGVAVFTLVSLTCSFGGDICCDGEVWLKWSKAERQAFMEGYVRALMHGYGRGCDSAFVALRDRKNKEADEISKECLKQTPVAGVNFTPFEDRITKFYTEHPEKRGKPLPTLIDELISTEHRTKDNQSRLPRNAGTDGKCGDGNAGTDGTFPDFFCPKSGIGLDLIPFQSRDLVTNTRNKPHRHRIPSRAE